MFENRLKGVQLVKRISYFYLIVAIFITIVTVVMGLNFFSTNIPCYVIMFVALYLISTKFQDNKNAWIFVVICAIIPLLWTLSLIGVALTLLLLVAANDMKKELD